MPSNQSKEVSDHTAIENPSLQRSRAMSKLLSGGQQYIEKGYLPLIIRRKVTQDRRLLHLQLAGHRGGQVDAE